MTVLLTHVSTTSDRCSVLRFSRLPRSPRISGCAARVYASRRNHNIFEVKDISPPPESLGLHSLPPVRFSLLEPAIPLLGSHVVLFFCCRTPRMEMK